MKRFVAVLLVTLLTACQATPVPAPEATDAGPIVLAQEENPYAPKPEDSSLIEAGILLTSLDLAEPTEANPGKSQLTILGSMPSVCDELRIQVNPPNPAYEIRIEIYSVINPKINCDNVFQQFETSILLGRYSAGVYSIWVNSKYVGDIVSYD